MIHDFEAGAGIDGMAVASDGRIVAAGGVGCTAVGVIVRAPQGKILAIIATPEEPAKVESGGDHRKTLDIAAGKSLCRVETSMSGFYLQPAPPR